MREGEEEGGGGRGGRDRETGRESQAKREASSCMSPMYYISGSRT